MHPSKEEGISVKENGASISSFHAHIQPIANLYRPLQQDLGCEEAVLSWQTSGLVQAAICYKCGPRFMRISQ